MAQLPSMFNREELPVDDSSYEPLPEGWYPVQITGAELKETKAGTGQYIKVEYTVVGDNYQGRKVWGMLNIVNPNETAENIGRKQLNQLMAATALDSVQDTDEFVGKTLNIKLKIKPASGEYEASNDVKGFKAGEVEMKVDAGIKEAGGKPPWAK